MGSWVRRKKTLARVTPETNICVRVERKGESRRASRRKGAGKRSWK